MIRIPLAGAAVLVTLLSACSGDDFEAQAEGAVSHHIIGQMKQQAAYFGGRTPSMDTVRVEDFKTSDCNDQGNHRRCKVSFAITIVREGKRQQMPDTMTARAVFSKVENQWSLIEIDD